MKKIKIFLKVIIVLILVIIVAWLAYKTFLLAWVVKLEKNFNESLGDNYHSTIVTTQNGGSSTQTDTWYTNTAVKTVVTNLATDNGNITEIYDDLESEKYTYVNSEQNTAYIAKGNSSFITYQSAFPLKYEYNMSVSSQTITKIWYVFSLMKELKTITTVDVDGIECYKVVMSVEEIYIDKSTNLYVKSYDTIGTNVTYDFSIGTVTEEDVTVPDLSDYAVTLH